MRESTITTVLMNVQNYFPIFYWKRQNKPLWVNSGNKVLGEKTVFVSFVQWQDFHVSEIQTRMFKLRHTTNDEWQIVNKCEQIWRWWWWWWLASLSLSPSVSPLSHSLSFCHHHVCVRIDLGGVAMTNHRMSKSIRSIFLVTFQQIKSTYAWMYEIFDTFWYTSEYFIAVCKILFFLCTFAQQFVKF